MTGTSSSTGCLTETAKSAMTVASSSMWCVGDTTAGCVARFSAPTAPLRPSMDTLLDTKVLQTNYSLHTFLFMSISPTIPFPIRVLSISILL